MIRTATDGTLRVVTLDRPERRNALTNEGLYDLADAVLDADEPVLYLTGAGEAFSAGADLDIVSDLTSREAREFAERGQRVATMLADYEGATVAGIDGPARGGGVELALACDLRVATPDATFAESGVSLGLFGAWGGTARLPDVVGRGEAMDLALTGRVVDAAEALRMGLVSRVVDEPMAVAERIAENDGEAVRVLAQRMRDTAPREIKEEREAQAFARLIESFDRDRNG